ncbi:MAG: DUF5618 family protein [Cytophagales bacterium]|nr:DUF5618 family protein [Cytophagales bacterium]
MRTIDEAYTYLDNAKCILSEKAEREDGFYIDKKYVKLAGHTAYNGVLEALDMILPRKKGRKSVEWYQENLSKIDKKMLHYFNNVYQQLHLVMGYDGIGDIRIKKNWL